MMRPTVACTRIAITVAQWKNLATLPQCDASLLAAIGFLFGLGFVGLGCAAVTNAFDLETELDVLADDLGVARDPELGTPDRRLRREPGLLLELVRIGADSVHGELDVDRLGDAVQRQIPVDDAVVVALLLDAAAREA